MKECLWKGPHSPMNVFEIIRFHRTSRRLKGHAFWLSLSHNYSSWGALLPSSLRREQDQGKCIQIRNSKHENVNLKENRTTKATLHTTWTIQVVLPFLSDNAYHLPLILTTPTVQVNKQTRITKESKWKPFPSGGSKANRMPETPILLCSSRVLSQGWPLW